MVDVLENGCIRSWGRLIKVPSLVGLSISDGLTRFRSWGRPGWLG